MFIPYLHRSSRFGHNLKSYLDIGTSRIIKSIWCTVVFYILIFFDSLTLFISLLVWLNYKSRTYIYQKTYDMSINWNWTTWQNTWWSLRTNILENCIRIIILGNLFLLQITKAYLTTDYWRNCTIFLSTTRYITNNKT